MEKTIKYTIERNGVVVGDNVAQDYLGGVLPNTDWTGQWANCYYCPINYRVELDTGQLEQLLERLERIATALEALTGIEQGQAEE